MAATYRLGLNAQTPGTNAFTWGNVLNTQAIELLDEAIAGVETIPVTGNMTLMSDNFVSNQARNAALSFIPGGAPGSATITIPAREKTYIVRNFSGAALTFTAGGATASLITGRWGLVVCNGVDVFLFDPVADVAQLAASANSSAATAVAQATIAVAKAAEVAGAAASAAARADDAKAAADSAAALVASFDVDPVARTAVPASLDVQFAEGFLPLSWSLQRASPGTRMNRLALLESVAANTLRHSYDPATGAYRGVLVERARTNLLKSSGDLRIASEGGPAGAWGSSGSTTACVGSTSSFRARDGVGFYTRLVFDGSTLVDRRQSAAISAGQTYCASAIFKRGTLPTASLGLHLTGGTTVIGTVNYTWATKRVSATSSPAVRAGVIPLSDDEALLWIAVTDDGDGTAAFMLVQATSAGTAGDTYVWGAQIEPGGFPSSYNPTTNAAVTREADILTRPIGSDWNPAEGAVLVRARTPQGVGGAQSLWQADDGSQNNRLLILRQEDRSLRCFAISGSAITGGIELPAVADDTDFAIAFAWRADGLAASLNGADAIAAAPGAPPNGLTTERIGGSASGEQWGGLFRGLTRWPRRLSNADLQAISKRAAA